MKVIFIAGASASGKTLLAEKLLEALQRKEKTAELIVMDSYYKEIPDNREISEYRANTNFDCVTMFQIDRLRDNILTLDSGTCIPKYHFEFSTNKQSIVGEITPPEFLIVEGLFTMHLVRKLPETIEKTTVFVETSSYKTIIQRRVTRDQESRGRPREEVIRCEKKFVGTAYFHNVASGMRGVDISVVNDDPIEGAQHPLDKGANEILFNLGIEEIIAEQDMTHTNMTQDSNIPISIQTTGNL